MMAQNGKNPMNAGKIERQYMNVLKMMRLTKSIWQGGKWHWLCTLCGTQMVAKEHDCR